LQKAKNKSDENDNQPRKTGQRPVQQDTLRRGLLHQHRREQGHLWCLDRAPDVQDGFFQFLFLSPRQWLCAVKLPQNRVTGRYGAPPVAAPATGMARGRSGTGLHLSYLSRRLYAHVHRRQVLRLSPAVLLSDRHATVPVCRAGRTGGIYAPLGEDKTGAAASCGRHLQPYRICALLSVGGYQPGIRQNLPSAGRSAEEQLCLPIQRPVGETYPRHAACSGICRYTPREPYHSEQFCNGAVRRVRHPSAQTTLVGGIEKRAVVLRPQREPVGGRVPLFRPQPSDALLQATDGKDIYAIYHGLPKWNIRMKSKKKLYKTCTPILFFCIFAVGESF